MIICCGEALIDMVPVPISGTAGGFVPLPGGSPFNTAVAIGRMGVQAKFLGRISTDFFGEMLIKRLKDNRVSDDLITRAGQNSTLAFVKLVKNKEPQYIFYADGTADRSFSQEDLPQKLPVDTNCIVFGSISMTMEPIASAIEALILREGTRKNTDQMDGAPLISFDPNIRSFMIKDRSAYIERLEKWVAASTIVKFSSGDFNFIYPKLETDKVLQKTIAMGPRLVIMTLGTKGALALLRRNDGNVIRVSTPAVNLPVVDTIGAGDAFHGAFLSWLELKGKMSRSALINLSETELQAALLFANKAAALVCSRQGADPPSRREVESLKLPEPKTTAGKTKTATKTPAPKVIKKESAKKK
jgi:fructokinase